MAFNKRQFVDGETPLDKDLFDHLQGGIEEAINANGDIRLLVDGLTQRLNALANSDDTTLDQLSEIVAYIKSNKTLIDSITTSKVNVADIINNLTTNATNKPLSAAQGVALKRLIDAIVVPTKTSQLENDSGFLTQKPTYTASEVGADAKGTASTAVKNHNESKEAHPDIRELISALNERVDNVSGGSLPPAVLNDASLAEEIIHALQDFKELGKPLVWKRQWKTTKQISLNESVLVCPYKSGSSYCVKVSGKISIGDSASNVPIEGTIWFDTDEPVSIKFTSIGVSDDGDNLVLYTNVGIGFVYVFHSVGIGSGGAISLKELSLEFVEVELCDFVSSRLNSDYQILNFLSGSTKQIVTVSVENDESNFIVSYLDIVPEQKTETWTFTLADGSTVTKKVVVE